MRHTVEDYDLYGDGHEFGAGDGEGFSIYFLNGDGKGDGVFFGNGWGEERAGFLERYFTS